MEAILNWKCLKAGGHIFLEIGEGQESFVSSIFSPPYFIKLHHYLDLQGIVRVLEFKYVNI